ncbi:sulfite reductase, ferredoxin dependent [Mastigocoleus testarum]|uniref:Sulfite reductase [ferredoxin] n=1 Tax=Mastigocoleus testarum BC008 TaxID=371196 RepID=A0A0V7ZS00_9CYAN|nr:sulfite reductase, ferredoxin dependent [Mastigocoleus testarum]KST67452.1 sulfite reductase [Mastigocoleus testarum BC008]
METSTKSSKRKPSKIEKIKANSNFLREPLATELLQDTNHFSEAALQILKFHGSYQQDNRDNRVKGQEKDYQMMLRTRTPGGFVPPQFYLALDRLSEVYGNQTLRITSRQAFQMHGIPKQDLKTVVADIVRSMGSTLGACGDLNRNVIAPPAPFKNRPEYQYAWKYANKVANLFTPKTGAYYEIWLDGDKIISAEESPAQKVARQQDLNAGIFTESVEPFYGTQYLPRKFKCCVTVPGDNSVDVYTHDISLVVITDQYGELEGFNVLTGGGMGRTHNKEETFARLSDHLGYVDKGDIYKLLKAIGAIQRDYGDRSNRLHARMKYLIHDWGIEKFKAKVESYFGKPLQPFKELPPWEYQDFLGWHEQGDGKLFLGILIENGRVQDKGNLKLKTALRKVVEQFNLPIRLTPNHNLIFYDIEQSQKTAIEKVLEIHGVEINPDRLNSLTRYGMACPALPTCGLAITESERALPGVLERINLLLEKLNMVNEQLVIRMTGCPNGCVRPYLAELGFVGRGPGTYQVWLGGTTDGTKLAQPYVQSLQIEDLEAFLEPIFLYFQANRKSNESFGVFCHRVGFDKLQEI